MALKCSLASSQIAFHGLQSVPQRTTASQKQQTLKALESLENMNRCGMSLSRDELYHLLEACSKNEDLQIARRVHALMGSNGLFSVTVLSDQLIRLFTGCGSPQEAIEVFQKVPHPTVFTCNAVMAAHTKLGNAHEVFQLYHRMHTEGTHGDTVTFLSILKACSSGRDLRCGRHIHSHMLIGSHENSTFIGNSLVDMYAKCGSLEDARSVFDGLSHRTEVSWGALLTGYSAGGYAFPTLELFESMKKEGVKPSRVTYLCALKASSDISALRKGRVLHAEIILDKLELDPLVGSTLLDMYAKCGSLEDAYKVFTALSTPDIVTWGAMIVGYSQQGHGERALELFEQMQKAGVKPGKVALSAALKACAGIGASRQGQVLYDLAIRHGFDTDTVLGSSVLDMYVKCQRLVDARRIFDNFAHRDLVTWGTMMAGYAQYGRGHAALDLFMRMQQDRIRPGKTTFLSALKACSSLGAIDEGRLLHNEVIEHKLDNDIAISNTLVDMYAKCGSLEDAQSVFYEIGVRDIVSWGAIIIGFVMHGYADRALDFFVKMEVEKLTANEVIYSGALKACGTMPSIQCGMLIHSDIIQSGFSSDTVVEGSLIDMYVKCGRLEEAHSVFGCLSSRDIISWGTLMMGFADAGDGLPVMELFTSMLKDGLGPDKVTLICSVKACGMLGALEWGKWVHAGIVEVKLEADVVLGTNLVEMYSKCDSIDDGQQVFKGMLDCDMASWGALIAGYASAGNFSQVHICLVDMQKQGLMPSDIIFTSILAACSQVGLVEEGCIYFQMMIEDFGISPSNEHCSCMVDLFARTGRLDDASDLTSAVNVCDLLVQRTLLSSCRTYRKVNLAASCFEEAPRIGFLHRLHG